MAFGPLSRDVGEAELIFVGSWTDKGTCSDRLRAVLPSLAGKQIFLFGTAALVRIRRIFLRSSAALRVNSPRTAP